MAQSSRNFCFTCNNYSDKSYLDLDSLEDVRFCGYGKEIAPSTGTPHLQGMVCFSRVKRVNFVRGELPGFHVEIMRGTAQQAWAYCIKTDPNATFTGELPILSRSNLAERYEAALALARSGAVEDMPADLYVRHFHTWRVISHEHASVSDLDDVCGVWIFGPSGCGKSRSVRADYPGHYDKPLNKWFDGYTDRYDGILLDDVDPSHLWLAPHLNRWADRYAFNGEVKGGTVRIRPNYVIVTSRYTIEQVFAACDESTRASILRRFKKIVKLGAPAHESPFRAFTQ